MNIAQLKAAANLEQRLLIEAVEKALKDDLDKLEHGLEHLKKQEARVKYVTECGYNILREAAQYHKFAFQDLVERWNNEFDEKWEKGKLA